MLNYSPNVGFKPRTRLEMIQYAYDSWVKITQTKDTFTDFQGTNIHLLLNVFLDHLEHVQSEFYQQQANQFVYWKEHNLAINNPLGASYEGWIRTFEPLCDGMDIISNAEDSSIKPGEIALYFDNLDHTDLPKIQDAFRLCRNISEPTPRGDKEVQIVYSNGKYLTCKYFNLEPENYTLLDIKLQVHYQKNAIQYKDTDFTNHFRKNFNRVNRINNHFYPNSYMDITAFKGVSKIVVESKLKPKPDSNTTWSAATRELEFGEKFTINSLICSIKNE